MRTNRTERRFTTRVPIVIEHRGTGLLVDGYTLDASGNGLRVVGPPAFEVGQTLDLHLELGGRDVTLSASVRWTHPLAQGHHVWVGLMLDGGEAGDRAQFRTFVSGLELPRPQSPARAALRGR